MQYNLAYRYYEYYHMLGSELCVTLHCVQGNTTFTTTLPQFPFYDVSLLHNHHHAQTCSVSKLFSGICKQSILCSSVFWLLTLKVTRFREPQLLPGIRARLPALGQLSFDIQQPVVLGDPLAPRRRTSFEMAGSQPDGQVGNKVIRRLSRTMRHKHSKVNLLCIFRPTHTHVNHTTPSKLKKKGTPAGGEKLLTPQ